MNLFITAYFAALLLEIAIRAPLDKKRRLEKKTDQRISTRDKALISTLFVPMLGIPAVYAATGWLDFADYRLPAWASWLGVAIMAGAVFVFWRAHVDLGLNWSPTLEIREHHELITHGIYGVLRHPMYASLLLWDLAQPLLLQNWIAGLLSLAFFVPFYVLRVRPEERMMLDTFGDQYRDYMKRVGGIFPRLSGRLPPSNSI
jgi:protein-S-isoprenylcysteine O-methyltransferase Ste14